MKKITIDFSLCKHPLDLHKELKEKLNFPEWYGTETDAPYICAEGTPYLFTLHYYLLLKKTTLRRCTRKDTTPVLFAKGELYCFAVIFG